MSGKGVLRILPGIHDQGVVGAHLDTDGTACAGIGCKLDRVVWAAKFAAPGLSRLVTSGKCLRFRLVQEERTDNSVRADHAAEIALGAVVTYPHGDLFGEGALLEGRLSDGCLPSCRKVEGTACHGTLFLGCRRNSSDGAMSALFCRIREAACTWDSLV